MEGSQKIRTIPEKWNKLRFEEIGSISIGKDLKEDCFQKTSNQQYKHPVYSNTVENGGLYGYYNFEEYKGNSVTIVGRGAGVGTAFPREEGYGAIGRLVVLKTNDNISSKYVSFYVNNRLRFFHESTGVPQLTGVQLAKYKILIPPLPEQQKIAQILNTWDKAIEKAETLIKAKQKLKDALMQQLLTGKKRFEEFKDEWQAFKLDSVFKERNERNCNDLPLLSITADKGVVNRDEVDKKDTSNEDKSKYKRICVGDIGYNTMRMWQGRSALSSLEGIVSPAYTIVTPTENTDALFMSYFFKLPKTVHLFYRYSQGLVSDTWNCKYQHFKLIKVKIPSTKEEQIKIGKVFKKLDDEIELLNQQRLNLENQKKGLMQQLLTGKKRVKV